MDKINPEITTQSETIKITEPTTVAPERLPSIDTSPLLTPQVRTELRDQGGSFLDVNTFKSFPENKPEKISSVYNSYINKWDNTDMGLLEASFNKHNDVAGFINLLHDPGIDDGKTDWDPIHSNPEELDGLEDYLPELSKAENHAERLSMINQIAKEQKANQVIGEANGLASFSAGLASGILSPTTLIPVFGWGKNIYKVAATGFGVAATQEAVLQKSQITRSLNESYANIAVNTIGLTGLGYFAKLKGAKIDGTDVIADAYKQNPSVDMHNIKLIPDDQTPKSLSAASSFDPNIRMTADESKVAGFNVAKYAVVNMNAPKIVLLHSDRHSIRELTNDMAEHSFELAGHANGKIYSPVSTSVELSLRDRTARMNTQFSDDFIKMKKADPTLKMTNDEFLAAIVKTAAKGGSGSGNAFIDSSAKMYRGILDEIASNLQSLNPQKHTGINAADVITDPFLYETRNVIAHEGEFLTKLSAGLKANLLKKDQAFIQDALDKSVALDVGFQVKDIDSLAEALATMVKRHIAYDDPKPFGKIAGIDVPIEQSHVADFLIRNPFELYNRLHRRYAFKIEADKRWGTSKFDDIISKVESEYEAELKAAVGNDKLTKAINAERAKFKTAFKSLYDEVAGNHYFEPPSTVKDAVKIIENMAAGANLPGALLSSLTDVSNHVLVNGISKIFSRSIPRIFDFSEFRKLSNAEIDQFIIGSEELMQNSMLSNMGIVEKYVRDPARPLESALNKSKQVAIITQKIGLLPYFTKAGKREATYLMQEKIWDAGNKLIKGKTLKPSEITDFAKVGLTQDHIKSIVENMILHGDTRGKWMKPNANLWTDSELTQVYKEALIRNADKTITTVKPGDLPKFLKSPITKWFFSYQAFLTAFNGQIVAAGFTKPERKFLMAIAGRVAIGYAQLYLKSLKTGNPMPKEWTGTSGIGMQILRETGLFGMHMSLYNKTFGLHDGWGIDEIGNKSLNYNLKRNDVEKKIFNQMGAVPAYVANLLYASNGVEHYISGEGMTKRELDAAFNILPGRRHWALNGFFNDAENRLANNLGVKHYRDKKDVISQYLGEIL